MKEIIVELLPWDCESCGLNFNPGEVIKGASYDFTPHWLATCPRCNSTCFREITDQIAKGTE